MSEKGKFDDVELWGGQRSDALAACRTQIEQWGLTMPAADPLVLDFGLEEFQQTGHIEFWVANQIEAGYCGKFLFVFDGQICPCHHHEVKHETFFVVKGAVRMTTDGREQVMNEGDLLVMRPGVKHTFQGLGPALLLEVSQPSVRGDNYFQDRRIGKDGAM